ncbi:helix-turn-helix domain-containing protein [Halosquirtibacter xylanolyticus]|uniref:helix-turn-helix domain-containing protein n=1 Tax=Halosquirtibacter xylanolyticus TaxID=3374599 RepID=UPI00374A11B9|nr:helix-turn-helix domain-containing protein [Prolixibacteraceae bacterium]
MTTRKEREKERQASAKRRSIEQLLREILHKLDHMMHITIQLIEATHRLKASKQKPTSNTIHWIDAQEVMNRLHISHRKLQGMRLDGSIPYTVLKGKILFKESDVENILLENYRRHHNEPS